MRRSSALVAMDRDGRVLLQHRTEDAPLWPGYWGLFGGGLEGGERYPDALVRELREEIGVDATGAVPLGSMRVGADHYVAFFYLEIDLSPESLEGMRKAQTEGQGLGAFRTHEISGLASVVPCDAIAIGMAMSFRRTILPVSRARVVTPRAR